MKTNSILKYLLLGLIVLGLAAPTWAGTAKKLRYGARFTEEAASHATPPAGYGDMFVKDNSTVMTLYFIDDAGNETDLIGAAATATDFELAADADAGNFDIDSLDRLEFVDNGLYIDGGTDATLLISSDGTLEIATADWDISTTGTITNASMSADQISAGTLSIGANALTITNSYLAIGTDPAEAGTIRLPNAGSLLFEHSTPGTDINALEVDSSQIVQIAKTGSSGVTITPAVTLSSTLAAGGTITVGAHAISGTTGTVTYSNWSIAADGDAAFVDLDLTGNLTVTGAIVQDAWLASGAGPTNMTIDAVGTGKITIAGTSTGIIWLGDDSGGATLVTVGDGTDLLLGEGKLTIDNDVDEDALVITSSATTESAIELTAAATTTGNTISVVADALVSGGKMIYLESGSIPSGAYYIYAYDGSGSPNFSVAQYGATTIEGNSTSDVLVVSAGDLQIDDGIFEVDTNEDVTSYVKRTQASVSGHVLSIIEETDTTTSAKAVLFLDQDTDSAPSSALEIDTEGAYAIKIDALVAGGDGIYIDVADTYIGQGIIADLGPWTGATGEGFIDISSDTGGSIQEVGQIIRIDLGGAGIAGTAVDGKALYAHSQAGVKTGESLIFLDTLLNTALEIVNEGTAADGIKMEMVDSYTGQGLVADMGRFVGTVNEGFFNFESDSHATAQIGQVIRINLQNTTLDTAAISGKAIYAKDASAYKDLSYLLHMESDNNGSAYLDGDIAVNLATNTDDLYITANPADYGAGSGVLSIYDTNASGQSNSSYLVRLVREAAADVHNQFILCQDSSTGVAGNGTTQFKVDYDGTTTITGTASGTDALIVTAGDILVTSGHIDITTGNLTVATGNIGLTTGNLQTDVGHAAIGIGTADIETWETSTQVSALQVGGAGFWAVDRVQAASDSSYFGHNAYFDDTDSQWEAISTAASDQAVMLQMTDGTWIFNVEDTAIAGDAAITWIPSLIIEETGDVGIGPATAAAIDTKFHIESASASEPVLKLENTAADSTAPSMLSINNDGIKNDSGDDLFTLTVGGFDTAAVTATAILIEAAANWGDSATDAPTSIKFYTVPDGSETATLALTIESDQDVLGAANIAALTYGSDSSISDAELLGIDDGATTEILVGGGAGVIAVWTTASGTGAPLRQGTPTLTTPVIGAATGTSLDLGTTTLYASRAITVDTGGVLDIVLASAAGDDFTVDTSKFVVSGDSGDIGIGTATPGTRLHVEEDNAATAASVDIARLSLTSTGTPAAGLGPALEFEVETAAGGPGNQEIIARIDAIATDVTGTSEEGALVFKTMNAGATAVEALRIQNQVLDYANETVTCITEAGTASPLISLSLLVTDGDADTDEDTVSLADGIGTGQTKIFVYLTETDVGDSVNVTPNAASGWTDILFEDPGDGCTMVWDGAGWAIIGNNGGTIT